MADTKLTIVYDGTPFYGWARQPGRRTIQDEVERALETVLRTPVTLTVAGRTDTGVHAWGQVASYPAAPGRLRPTSVNAVLPDEIAVVGVEAAPDGFDARRDARSRTYCYRVLHRSARDPFLRGRAMHHYRAMDRDALTACAALLPGAHDFTAFTPSETNHSRFVRTVLGARWEADGDLLSFWIEANSFLRNMNRILVGTMLEVARGARTIESFAALLDGRPREEAGATAAAHGLALARVRYDS